MENRHDTIPPAAVVVVVGILLILSCSSCSCSPLLQSSETQREEYSAAAGAVRSGRAAERRQHLKRPLCKFPAIFNFGDSNSDTGGLSAAFGQVGPPSGETFFHTPMGRYCDGRLKIDFIAQTLGLPYLNAFLDSIGSNFTHGSNFATAGSTIRPQNTTLHQSGGFSPISLNTQYTQYTDFQHRSQIIRSKSNFFKKLLPPQNHFTSALYTFDIGQNDLTSGYFQNMSTHRVKTYVPDVLGQFSWVIKSIYHDKGGRYFWIHNTGPVGCLPYVRELFPVTPEQVDHAGCSSPYNEVAKYYNMKLKETVMRLRDELPYAAITYVDVYSVMYDLISNASRYGFKDPFQGCNTGKVKKRKKGGHDGKVITEPVVCKDPSVVINWDGVHYTEAGNKWVFDRIVNGDYSDPPNSLNMACHREY